MVGKEGHRESLGAPLGQQPGAELPPCPANNHPCGTGTRFWKPTSQTGDLRIRREWQRRGDWDAHGHGIYTNLRCQQVWRIDLKTSVFMACPFKKTLFIFMSPGSHLLTNSSTPISLLVSNEVYLSHPATTPFPKSRTQCLVAPVVRSFVHYTPLHPFHIFVLARFLGSNTNTR